MESRDPLVFLGAAIRAARMGSSLSQEALALASGLDRSYVGGIERGERNVSYLNLVRIAAGAHVGLDLIVAEALRLEAAAAIPGQRSVG
jgi:transcriptional regulator with XRE-family HTH domain